MKNFFTPRLIIVAVIMLVFGFFFGMGFIAMGQKPAATTEPQTVIITATEGPTQTPFVITATNPPVMPTQAFIPTATIEPPITNTPTITLTLTNTKSPTALPDQTHTDKGPGFYLVGTDIAPGVWRSRGTGDSCYWATTSKTGDILSNHFGMAGGTMYVAPSAWQVEINKDCGYMTYIGQ